MTTLTKTATDLRRELSVSLDLVETGGVVEVTKHGKVIARLVPASATVTLAPVVTKPTGKVEASPEPLVVPQEAAKPVEVPESVAVEPAKSSDTVTA